MQGTWLYSLVTIKKQPNPTLLVHRVRQSVETPWLPQLGCAILYTAGSVLGLQLLPGDCWLTRRPWNSTTPAGRRSHGSGSGSGQPKRRTGALLEPRPRRTGQRLLPRPLKTVAAAPRGLTLTTGSDLGGDFSKGNKVTDRFKHSSLDSLRNL